MATYIWLRGHISDQINALMNGWFLKNNYINQEIFILHKDYTSKESPFYKTTSCLPEFLNFPFPYSDKELFPEFNDLGEYDLLNILGEIKYKDDYIFSTYIDRYKEGNSIIFLENNPNFGFTTDKNHIKKLKSLAQQCSLKKKIEVQNKDILDRDLLIIPTRGYLVGTPELEQYCEFASKLKNKKLYVFSNNSKDIFNQSIKQYINTKDNDVIIDDNPNKINWKLGNNREQNLEMQRKAFQLFYDLAQCNNVLYPEFNGDYSFGINYLRDVVIFMKNLGDSNA